MTNHFYARVLFDYPCDTDHESDSANKINRSPLWHYLLQL